MCILGGNPEIVNLSRSCAALSPASADVRRVIPSQCCPNHLIGSIIPIKSVGKYWSASSLSWSCQSSPLYSDVRLSCVLSLNHCWRCGRYRFDRHSDYISETTSANRVSRSHTNIDQLALIKSEAFRGQSQ